jgi:HTH-type transcriptional regulator/antitoxin MqsA
MEEKVFCPDSGVELVRDVRPFTITYKGKSHTFEMPGLWAVDGSENAMFLPEDMKVSDKALNLLKAKVENLVTPEHVKRIRQRLKLSQAKAGELIGGGPRAFQKYEAGSVLVSRGVSSALRLLEAKPDMLSELTSAQDEVKA